MQGALSMKIAPTATLGRDGVLVGSVPAIRRRQTKLLQMVDRGAVRSGSRRSSMRVTHLTH